MREQKLQDIWFILNILETKLNWNVDNEIQETYYYLLDLQHQLQKQ
jgi:hypothetical protein